MVKSVMREIALAIQARSGASAAVLVWLIIVAIAALTAFAFLCVAAYVWLEGLFGGAYAGLIVAGFFIVVALIAAFISALARQRAKQRAILERTARAHAAGSWLLDPKFLPLIIQVGRSLGWQRLLPVALLGFVAAQWARSSRGHGRESGGSAGS